ncbi:MAG: hypothetical protein KGL39_11315 [Patescibacteria group bacterium]|nr:hypothetical protein [Patescibacteria group bacterium]
MGQSLTKREVAEVVGVSARTVERRAGEWSNEDGAFDLAKLPPEAQVAWARRAKVVELAPPGQLTLSLTVPAGPNLSDEDRAEAEKRYSVIEPLVVRDKYALLWTQCRQSKMAMVEYLVKMHQVKQRTVYHWLKLFKEGGLPALVTKDRADKGIPRVLNNAALDFLLAAALPKKGSYGTLSVAEIFRAYQEERAWRSAHAGCPLGEFDIKKYARYLDGFGRLKPDAQLPDASPETFRNWFHRIPEVVRVMAREGEEAFHNTQEVLSFRALTEIRPLDYVVMDHRRLDFFCMLRDGRAGWKLARPWLTAAIDMRTRKWLGWVIVENPSSDSIAAVLKRTFLDHGLPTCLYWDNGKDFTCEWFEGKTPRNRKAERVGELATAWRGVLETLSVRVHHAIVKRARSKIIEPNFGNTANFDKTLPWYCGHKPTARPERFEDLLDHHERWMRGEIATPPFPTIEEAAGIYDEFLTSLNEREHSGEGMRKITATGQGWMCPNEAWERLIGQVEKRAVPPEVLQFCFAKRRTLTVRNGEVRSTFGGRQFHYRMADSGLKLMAYNGCEAELAYDPLDLGTAALYIQSRFVGLANCIELRRMGEDAFTRDERDRRTARREVKKFIGAVHAQVSVPDYRERGDRRRAVLPERAEPERQISGEVAVPAPIQEAAAADTAAKQFSFADAPEADLVVRTVCRDDEDEFRFFKNQGD